MKTINFSVFVFTAALIGVTSLAAEKRPNIVFILADDLGYGDLGCYGRTDIRTPELDSLARQGVRLTEHYANGAECTPTRAAFLTGRYQQWVGGLECAIGTGNVGRYDDAIRLRSKDDLGLPAELPTIGHLLKSAGYATALCGKWHLGYESKFAPHRHGFDFTYYCIGGEMDYFHYLDKAAGYNLFVDGNPVTGKGYFTDLMTDKAIEFIEGQSADTPFFLYLPYTCPHAPFQGHEDAQAEPLQLDSPLWNQGKAPPDVYVAMIEHMDLRIGDVLRKLDQEGLADNTVVIFASDNGGTKSARNTPLRGIKGSTFEGGIRVPGIVRWPGHLPGGTVSDQICLTFDFTRSIANLAGVDEDATNKFEGIDIVRHLAEQKPNISRTLFWRKQRRDRVWKAVRDGDLKYVEEARPDATRAYLFNLANDVGETNDLRHSEATQFQRIRQMYNQWESVVRAARRGRPEKEPSN